MRSKKGKKFNSRGVAPTSDGKAAQANQWQASEKQLLWLNYYMNPREKDTYANAYEAAIKAGYSKDYARQIMSPSLALQWVQSAKSIMRSMNTEHLRSMLEDIVLSKYEKTSDRIAAAKLLGIDQGMFVQKQITAHVGLEQAIEALE
jgi:phage terminase small subunit